MKMRPRLRKLALIAHVTCSVGWLGSVLAYLAPAVVGLTANDVEVVRSCQLVMQLIGWFVIAPLAIGTLLTGVVQSLGTEWGLFRHYWIATKLVLAIVGATILIMHMRGTVDGLSAMNSAALMHTDASQLKLHLVVHAAGGVVILLAATVLSIWKPWGKTRYGKRRTA